MAHPNPPWHNQTHHRRPHPRRHRRPPHRNLRRSLADRRLPPRRGTQARHLHSGLHNNEQVLRIPLRIPHHRPEPGLRRPLPPPRGPAHPHPTPADLPRAHTGTTVRLHGRPATNRPRLDPHLTAAGHDHHLAPATPDHLRIRCRPRELDRPGDHPRPHPTKLAHFAIRTGGATARFELPGSGIGARCGAGVAIGAGPVAIIDRSGGVARRPHSGPDRPG